MPKCPCNEPKIDGGETCRFCPLLVTFGSIEADSDTTTCATVDIGDCGGEGDEQFPMMNGGW